MAVANVNEPRKISEVDPKSPKTEEPEDVRAIQNEVKKTRARRELVEERRLTEMAQNPPEAPEPPFKVTGGINLGNIDIQEQQRKQEESARIEREKAQERIEKAEAAAKEAREALQNAQLRNVQDSLMAQIETLKTAVQNGSRRDIVSEITAIEAVANKLGLSRGEPVSGDLQTQLAIKKLEADIARENRKFNLEVKKHDQMLQIELRKLDQDAKAKEAAAEAERNKYALIANLPEQIGGVIAKGIAARASQNGAVATQPQQPQEVRSIEAVIGEAGEIACPTCGGKVGIGPDTNGTVCANCQQQFVVRRIAAQAEE